MYDLSKLTRDYQTHPLAYGEWPIEEDVRYLYIECNMPELELRKFFNRSRRCIKQWITKWNLVKNKDAISKIRKNTIKTKYGVDSLYEVPEYREKLQSTFQAKYGTNSPFENPDIQRKAQQGFQNFLNDEEKFNNWKNNHVKTNNYRYGCHSTQTHLPKDTVEISNSKEKLQSFILSLPEEERTPHIIAEKLKVHHTNINQKLLKYDLKPIVKFFSTNESTQHREVKQLLEDLDITYDNNNREVLGGKELDLYCPIQKLGIEINGDYWHTVDNKGRGYHQKKSLLAEDKGLFVYHIFEHEWLEKKSLIISQLKNLLGKNEQIVYARKCKIKEVQPIEARNFLNNNHLQGSCNSSIKLGLYYESELVAIMTFGKPRFNKKYQWELLRFCCKSNTSVVGGPSKLFKYFIRTYNPDSILSYSDIAHTKGTMYSLLGFELLEISNPNYIWVKRHKILTRYKCQKHKLLEKFPEFEGLSESEIMTELGYQKVEDSGNKVWLWSKSLV